MNEEAIRRRIRELLAVDRDGSGLADKTLYAGAISVASALFGPKSPQVEALERAPVTWHGTAAQGFLKTAQDDLDAGMIGSLRATVSGEVLADFVTFAREALAADSPNVAAVLAAAAYEDVIRRLGERLAAVSDRRALPEVLSALKGAGVLDGPQVSIAQSFLPFRNAALHANWERIDRPAIDAALGFVDALLMKHFS